MFVALQSAFPEHHPPPARRLEVLQIAGITGNVRRELLPPELLPGRRRRRKPAPFMPMPKTPMHEYRRLESGKHYIGPPGQLRVVKAKPEPASMQCPAQYALGPGVATPDAGHHPRACVEIDDVRQSAPWDTAQPSAIRIRP